MSGGNPNSQRSPQEGENPADSGVFSLRTRSRCRRAIGDDAGGDDGPSSRRAVAIDHVAASDAHRRSHNIDGTNRLFTPGIRRQDVFRRYSPLGRTRSRGPPLGLGAVREAPLLPLPMDTGCAIGQSAGVSMLSPLLLPYPVLSSLNLMLGAPGSALTSQLSVRTCLPGFCCIVLLCALPNPPPPQVGLLCRLHCSLLLRAPFLLRMTFLLERM